MDDKLIATADGIYTDETAGLVADPSDRESPFIGSIVSQGYRGYAWLLIVELFTGLLAGNGPSLQNDFDPTADHPWKETMFFAAIDPDRLLGPSGAGVTATELFSRLGAMDPAAGFDRVRVPGWNAAERELRSSLDGPELRPEVLRDLQRLADDLGVDLDIETHYQGGNDETSKRN